MPKQSVKAEVNTFVKGLITEASPLNFPEGASLGEENFELLKTGVRQRRLGLDYENNYFGIDALGLPPGVVDSSKVSTGIWKNVGGVANKNYLVTQLGTHIYFFDLDKQNLTYDGFLYTLVLSFSSGQSKFSFTSIDGKLIVAAGSYEIAVVSEGFTVEYVTLKTRDLWGVETYINSDNDPSYRPYGVEVNNLYHWYNLYNQSWGVPRRAENQEEGSFTDPVGYFYSKFLTLPSNVETVWTAVTTKADPTPYEFLRPNAWKESFGATPSSAKGYFIIDPLKRGQARQQALVANKLRHPEINLSDFVFKDDVTQGGASIVCEFAGRVFFGGFKGEVFNGDERSPILSNYLFFSQVVKAKNDITKCYQEGDPTSREGSDVVDTDGGFIRISGAQDVIELVALGSSLIVVASNGLWVVSGGSDYGFSATNYKVTQISDFGCTSVESVVKVNDTVVYWGEQGIYQVSKDQFGGYVVNSLTDNTIQTFYSEISNEAKTNAFGAYDAITKTIRWMYYDSFIFDGSAQYELVLDTRIPAFYKYKINNLPTTMVRGMFPVTVTQKQTFSEDVYSDTDIVLVGTDIVQIPYSKRLPTLSGVRYLILELKLSGTRIFHSFGYYKDTSFKDFYSVNNQGVDAKAFLLTGAVVAGDSSVDKQTPYLTVHLERTETGIGVDFEPENPSSCLMRSVWEWSANTNSNKWSPLYQTYRYTRGFIPATGVPFDTGFSLITTKNKLRGRGKAVSIYFETEPEKDCKLVGWNLNINGNKYT